MWNDFLQDEENREDYRLYRLARRAMAEQFVDLPDVESKWEAFRNERITKKEQHTLLRHRTLWISVASVAALLAVLFCFQWMRSASQAEEGPYVAMQYNASPQQILLSGDESTLALHPSQDSISFLAAAPEKSSAAGHRAAKVLAAAPAASQAAKIRTLSTPRGVDFKVILPDGTEVHLNAESSLQFPTAFDSDNRTVILKGEAYFKVARDEAHPFIVETDKMKIKVLGTEFNFRNYDPEHPFVALVNGSISIMDSDVVLNPGQGALIDPVGKLNVEEVNTYSLVQWVYGYFHFRQRPLIEVMQELGRWYNLGVVFENPRHLQTLVHFSALRSSDVEETVKNLNRMQLFRISREGNNLIVR